MCACACVCVGGFEGIGICLVFFFVSFLVHITIVLVFSKYCCSEIIELKEFMPRGRPPTNMFIVF